VVGLAVSFLWHFPWARAPQALPGTLPCGARTFLPPQLMGGATVRASRGNDFSTQLFATALHTQCYNTDLLAVFQAYFSLSSQV
jgi:hypothetical protein